MTPKQRAAEAALAHVESGMSVGLGSGSTAEAFIALLGQAVQRARFKDIRTVATSIRSEQLARESGLYVLPLERCAQPDLVIDGADEIDPQLNLIKGLGGALLREKLVALASKKMIIIADISKLVERLGTRSPLPVEVVAFAHEIQVPFLSSLGCAPSLRAGPSGTPFLTDNGNVIYDCRFNSIDDPVALQSALDTRSGVVECGLFLNIATLALVADDRQIQTLARLQKHKPFETPTARPGTVH